MSEHGRGEGGGGAKELKTRTASGFVKGAPEGLARVMSAASTCREGSGSASRGSVTLATPEVT